MTRQFIILLCSAVATIAALFAMAQTVQQRDEVLAGYVNPATSTDLPYRISRSGVTIDLLNYNAVDLGHQLDQMAGANLKWVVAPLPQTPFSAATVTDDWQETDTIIALFDQYPSVELIPSLDIANVEVIHDLPHFLNRYSDTIDYYEIAIPVTFNPQEDNTLQDIYNTIHTLDEYAVILVRVPDVYTPDDDSKFLAELFSQQSGMFSDAISIQLPPSFYLDGYESAHFFRYLASIREMMVENGVATNALWLTGPSFENFRATDCTSPLPVSTALQRTQELTDHIEQYWPWIGASIITPWQPTTDCSAVDVFSAIEINGKPSIIGQNLLFSTLPHAASNGLLPALNPYVSYAGTWVHSPQGADIGWTNDSRVSFTFSGNEIALYVNEGDYVAYLYTEIDGEPANRLPQLPDGTAFLNLRSDTLQQTSNLVTLADDLQNGTHVLTLIGNELNPDDTANHWGLAGFAVSSGDLERPYDQQIRWGLIAVAIAGIASLSFASTMLTRYLPFVQKWLNQPIHRLFMAFTASMGLMLGMFLTWRDGIPSIFQHEVSGLALSLVLSGVLFLNIGGLLLALICGVILFFLIFRELEIGLILTAFWAPFFLFPVELYHYAFPVAEIILMITLAAWLVHIAFQRLRSTHPYVIRPTLNSLDILMGIWVLLGILAFLQSPYRGPALTELRTLIIQPALFYLMLRTIRNPTHTYGKIIAALVSAGIIVVIYGMFSEPITAENGTYRMASVYGSPNNVGLFLGRCIPFALAASLLITQPIYKWLVRAALIVLLAGALLTQSAGALFIGIPVSCAVVLILIWKRRAWPVFAILILVLAGAFVLVQDSPRFSRMTDISSGTNFYRLRVWQSAINILEDHPVTGIGLDQFLYQYRGQYILPDAWEEPELSHPHNIALDFWLRLGILGLVWLLMLQTFFWRIGLSSYRVAERGAIIHIGALGAMTNLLAHGLVDNSVFVYDLALVFAFILAVIAPNQNTRAIDAAI